jgi:hypothetical protein
MALDDKSQDLQLPTSQVFLAAVGPIRGILVAEESPDHGRVDIELPHSGPNAGNGFGSQASPKACPSKCTGLSVHETGMISVDEPFS